MRLSIEPAVGVELGDLDHMVRVFLGWTTRLEVGPNDREFTKTITVAWHIPSLHYLTGSYALENIGDWLWSTYFAWADYRITIFGFSINLTWDSWH